MAERSERSQRALDEILGVPGGKGDQPAEAAPGLLGQQAAPRRPRKPESAWGLIIAGFFLSVVGGAALAGSPVWLQLVGVACVALAGICMLVGAIAVGVRWGMAWVAYDRGF